MEFKKKRMMFTICCTPLLLLQSHMVPHTYRLLSICTTHHLPVENMEVFKKNEAVLTNRMILNCYLSE